MLKTMPGREFESSLEDWLSRSDGDVCLVFADIVGSALLVHRQGTRVYAHVLSAYRLRAESLASAHNGRIISKEGDEIFAAFLDAPTGYRFARELNDDAGHTLISVRVGVHVGHVSCHEARRSCRADGRASDGSRRPARALDQRYGEAGAHRGGSIARGRDPVGDQRDVRAGGHSRATVAVESHVAESSDHGHGWQAERIAFAGDRGVGARKGSSTPPVVALDSHWHHVESNKDAEAIRGDVEAPAVAEVQLDIGASSELAARLVDRLHVRIVGQYAV